MLMRQLNLAVGKSCDSRWYYKLPHGCVASLPMCHNASASRQLAGAPENEQA